jgi:penicillin-binding protein 1B
MTAIQSGKYHWATPIKDEPIAYPAGGKLWTPKNYAGRSYGDVPMLTALANSYNQSAVNVGMDFGVDVFAKQLRQLGVESEIPHYPSVMLGAVDLSPMDMLGVYQVFANDGNHTPIHSIRQVISETGKVIQRIDDNIKSSARIPPEVMTVTNFGLQQVVKKGTAKGMGSIGNTYQLAGKTGTTNDTRDAWFAGFSGNYVSVVWVGRDDNKPIGLTGGSGALPIWSDYMKRLNLTPVQLNQSSDITWLWLDGETGLLLDETCERAMYVPVLSKYAPKESSSCLDEQFLDEYIDKTIGVDGNEMIDEGEVIFGNVDATEGF